MVHLQPASEETYGDYLVFVDESGDHGLVHCDPSYPVFVLVFCVVAKKDYADVLCPALAHFKFKHFGHDLVVLHEHEIRKARGSFAFLVQRERREAFQADLTELVRAAPITLVAVVIHKERLKLRYNDPANPYDLALEYGLERVARHLKGQGQVSKRTPIV